MSEPKLQDKPFQISKWVVWEAFARVKANKGAAGVDGQSIAEFEQERDKNLYRIWNRLSSGSYFPPPVKRWRSPRPEAKGFACSGCRRRRHSAASSSDGLGFVLVTHPFHALSGQRLEVLFVKRRGADSVFVCSGGVSGQMTVSRSWTDQGVPSQPHRLAAEGLAELYAVTRAIQGC